LSIFNPSADEDEKPLDPAMLRVQRKLRRLILIAGLTLGLGILAVLAAVIYRIFSVAPPAPAVVTAPVPAAAVTSARLTLSDLGLPADARLLSSTSDGSRVVLTYAHSGGATVIFIDPRRLTVVGRLELPAGP
jgi:hypothetical protein